MAKPERRPTTGLQGSERPIPAAHPRARRCGVTSHIIPERADRQSAQQPDDQPPPRAPAPSPAGSSKPRVLRTPNLGAALARRPCHRVRGDHQDREHHGDADDVEEERRGCRPSRRSPAAKADSVSVWVCASEFSKRPSTRRVDRAGAVRVGISTSRYRPEPVPVRLVEVLAVEHHQGRVGRRGTSRGRSRRCPARRTSKGPSGLQSGGISPRGEGLAELPAELPRRASARRAAALVLEERLRYSAGRHLQLGVHREVARAPRRFGRVAPVRVEDEVAVGDLAPSFAGACPPNQLAGRHLARPGHGLDRGRVGEAARCRTRAHGVAGHQARWRSRCRGGSVDRGEHRLQRAEEDSTQSAIARMVSVCGTRCAAGA